MSHARSSFSIAAGGLIAMAAGIGIGRFVFTPILPAMLADLGLTAAGAGFIASANFAGYLAGALGASRAALPGSRRGWLLGALAVSAITTGGMGLVSSRPAFMLLRFLGGVTSALVLILSSALVLDRLARSGQARLAALHFSGVGVGIVASAVAVSGLLTSGAGWRAMWFASGALAAVACLGVALLVPAGEPAMPVATTGRARDPRLRRMVLAYGLFGFGYVVTATFLVTIVRATPAVRAMEPAVWVLVGLSAAPSVLVWGAVGRRFGVASAFAAAALVEAVGVLASVAWPSAVGICVASVLVGGTFMGLTAMGLMRARELASGHTRGGDARRAMAAMTAAFGVGQIVGPVVAGILADWLGGFGVPSAAAAVALVGAALLARG